MKLYIIKYGYINKKNVDKYINYLKKSYASIIFTNTDNPSYQLLLQVAAE